MSGFLLALALLFALAAGFLIGIIAIIKLWERLAGPGR